MLHYSIPFTSQTNNFVVQRTFLPPPCHSTAFDLIPLISESSFWRSAKDAASFSPWIDSETADSDEMTIRNESSVSMLADRELRFVDPKRVRTGRDEEFGDSHTPISNRSQVHLMRLCETLDLSRGRSTLVFPTRSTKPPPHPPFLTTLSTTCQLWRQLSWIGVHTAYSLQEFFQKYHMNHRSR